MSDQSRRKARRHKKKTKHYEPSTRFSRIYDDGWERREPVPPRPALDLPALKAAITRNLDLDALGVELRTPGIGGVGIYRDGDRVGLVKMDRAEVGRHLPMGDYTADGGEHWDRLAEYVAEAVAREPEVVAAPVIPSAHLAKALPDSITDDDRELVRSASAVIKARPRDYGMPHVLDTPAYLLTFWPIDEVQGVAGVPFRFAPLGGTAVDGRLCYRQAGDIVPVMVSSEVADDVLAPAWVSAACDFAKLLDDPEHQPEPGPEDSPGEPTGSRTLGVAGARVGAFKRHLPPGQHASPEARARAAAVDVELAPEGETWVSEYIRGKPSDEPVRIQWTPAVDPAQLGLQVRRAA